MTFSLGCEGARRRTETINGVRLHFLESGRAGAPGICFLHGGAAHAHWFDAVTLAFVDRFQVVALDQRVRRAGGDTVQAAGEGRRARRSRQR